jgi:hypothetical protein
VPPDSVAIRQAIEARLNGQARQQGVDANRLRRALVFERLLVRLESAEPGTWVVKGGMALEWRLGRRARSTRDLDLVMRGASLSGSVLRDRLVESLSQDPQRDQFTFEVGAPTELDVGFRLPVRAMLAGREFASVRLDVASRAEELQATERLRLPPAVHAYNALTQPNVELAAASQHFAEKLHALTRDYGDHPNTRLRDLVDLVILIESDLVEAKDVLPVVRRVFEQRALHPIPKELPDPPAAWGRGFSQVADEVNLRARTLADAMVELRRFWDFVWTTGEGTGRG